MILIVDSVSCENFLILSLWERKQMLDLTRSRRKLSALLLVIDEFLRKNGKTAQAIQAIIVLFGNLSFSDSRALTISANMWSSLLRIPVWGVRKSYQRDRWHTYAAFLKKEIVERKEKIAFHKHLHRIIPYYVAAPHITTGKK